MLQKKVVDEDSPQTFFLSRIWQNLHALTYKRRVGRPKDNVVPSCNALGVLKKFLGIWWPNECNTFCLHATVLHKLDLKLKFVRRDITRHGRGFTRNEEGESQCTFEKGTCDVYIHLLFKIQEEKKLITDNVRQIIINRIYLWIWNWQSCNHTH